MARMSRRSLLGALAAILFALVVPGPAWASVTCSFIGNALSISMSTPEDRAAVVRSGTDIEVTDGTNQVPCGGTPTVTTTDQIQVTDTSNGTTEFTIDLSQGPFAPGFTDEEDGTSEIEFSVDLGGFFPDRLVVVGTDGADDMLFRSDGLNLNNGAEPLLVDKDVDVTTSAVEQHVVNAGGGADVIEGNPIFPGPFSGTLILNGEDGADTLTGGAGPDQLHGGDGNDVLAGYDGADDLWGDAGMDILDGDRGNDDLFGGTGADTLNGGDGNDRLDGGSGPDEENGDDGDDVFDQGASANGADVLNGGDGNLDFDVAAYDLRVNPLTITVGGGGSDGEALEGDTVGSDVEGVLGGAGNDTITGVAAGVDHILRGGGGADTIDAGSGDDLVDGDAGNDLLLGGAGEDTVSFFGAPAVTVDLASGSATGEGTDSFSGFENAEGGAFGDVLIGDGDANTLTGRGGPDSLSGGPGDDTLRGGDGADTASYTSAPGPVTVNLRTGIGTGDGSDTLQGIENAAGGAAGDSLTGNEQGNLLLGNGGGDDLRGNGGNDDLRGGSGDDVLDGNGDDDTIAGGDGNDVLSGDLGADVFLESEQRRANGADQISGGPGRDLLTYAGRRNGVRVSIGAGKPDGQKREGDRVGGDVEKVRGTGGRDILIGNGANNTLIGAAGNDILQGRGGRDRLLGGGGNDRLDGGPGRNVCRGGGGKNVLKNCGKREKPRR